MIGGPLRPPGEAQPSPLGVRPLLPATGYRLQFSYQLAFRTPGIMPNSDSSLKQMRHSPNRRRNARDRPHRPQRLCCRTSNFGFRLLFSIMALRAICRLSSQKGTRERQAVAEAAMTFDFSSVRNGMPSSLRSANATSSRSAVVTNVMSMPCTCSIMS